MKYSPLAVLLMLSGCGVSEDYAMPFGPYVSLDERPEQLRADFNARSDQTRLLFIVGPT